MDSGCAPTLAPLAPVVVPRVGMVLGNLHALALVEEFLCGQLFAVRAGPLRRAGDEERQQGRQDGHEPTKPASSWTPSSTW
jgi:hypothetical protein